MHSYLSRYLTFIGVNLCFGLILLLQSNMAANSAELVTDLSKNEISIETNFTGEKILLFGAIDPGQQARNLV